MSDCLCDEDFKSGQVWEERGRRGGRESQRASVYAHIRVCVCVVGIRRPPSFAHALPALLPCANSPAGGCVAALPAGREQRRRAKARAQAWAVVCVPHRASLSSRSRGRASTRAFASRKRPRSFCTRSRRLSPSPPSWYGFSKATLVTLCSKFMDTDFRELILGQVPYRQEPKP